MRQAYDLAMLTKEHVLAEIRRTAEANGGVALGHRRFSAETGIHQHDWLGRWWARWNDAVAEAGCAPNQLQRRHDEGHLLTCLAEEVRRLGRIPTAPELALRRRQDASFPDVNTFRRFGPKAAWPAVLLAYRDGRPEYADVVAIVAPLVSDAPEPPEAVKDDAAEYGFVYLLKSGRYYKVGHTRDLGRRRYDLAIQLPDPVREEHTIRTDDPAGIERYWHERFAERRKNGEWFELTRADVAAFKRRKFM